MKKTVKKYCINCCTFTQQQPRISFQFSTCLQCGTHNLNYFYTTKKQKMYKNEHKKSQY